MTERPVVGVRYCGGCNPRHDRTAAVRQLQTRFPALRFLPAAPGQPVVLVVCGCSVQCADVSGLDGTLIWLRDSPELDSAAGQLLRRFPTSL